mmetsp:Transcript_105367/g.339855  ORF Transcript_105367/g.339855 Transcript_105367/m.339855 type:complete len:241 (+) Transcript_105367:209-931(+)
MLQRRGPRRSRPGRGLQHGEAHGGALGPVAGRGSNGGALGPRAGRGAVPARGRAPLRAQWPSALPRVRRPCGQRGAAGAASHSGGERPRGGRGDGPGAKHWSGIRLRNPPAAQEALHHRDAVKPHRQVVLAHLDPVATTGRPVDDGPPRDKGLAVGVRDRHGAVELQALQAGLQVAVVHQVGGTRGLDGHRHEGVRGLLLRAGLCVLHWTRRRRWLLGPFRPGVAQRRVRACPGALRGAG